MTREGRLWITQDSSCKRNVAEKIKAIVSRDNEAGRERRYENIAVCFFSETGEMKEEVVLVMP